MASANKIINNKGVKFIRITDTSLGRRLQYAHKLEKFSAKQWLLAHNEVMQVMETNKRQTITNREMKVTVSAKSGFKIVFGIPSRAFSFWVTDVLPGY